MTNSISLGDRLGTLQGMPYCVLLVRTLCAGFLRIYVVVIAVDIMFYCVSKRRTTQRSFRVETMT
jgi:hypothetical protein